MKPLRGGIQLSREEAAWLSEWLAGCLKRLRPERREVVQAVVAALEYHGFVEVEPIHRVETEAP